VNKVRGVYRPPCLSQPAGRIRVAGFTLIEAVVALALIGGVGIALFSWINSNIMALSRVQDANARVEATANALEFMNTVNPMLKPEGKAAFGNYQLKWKAAPITALQDGANYPSGISLFQFALYDNVVTIETAEGESWFAFTLRQVGYKRVRDMRLPFG
jgi:general secretion pathway protein I